MQKILFRGKSVETGEWIYGYLIRREERSGYACAGKCFIDNGQPFNKAVEVVPITVGQYTGVNDVDGEKIFEGDVLRTTYDDSEYIVRFNETTGAFRLVFENGVKTSAMWSGDRYRRCGTVFDVESGKNENCAGASRRGSFEDCQGE